MERKIIVVDDDPDYLEMIEDALTVLGGHKVTTLTDPKIALEELNKNKFDLGLVDLVFPSTMMSGEQLIRIIKESMRLRDLPIIVVTATNNWATKYPGLSQLTKDIITKPFEIEKLLDAVNQIK